MSRQWKTPYRDPNYYGSAMGGIKAGMAQDKYRVLKKLANKNSHQHNVQASKLRKKNRAIEARRAQLANDPQAVIQRRGFMNANRAPTEVVDDSEFVVLSDRNAAKQHHCATTQWAPASNPGSDDAGRLNRRHVEDRGVIPSATMTPAARPSMDQRNTPGSRLEHTETGR